MDWTTGWSRILYLKKRGGKWDLSEALTLAQMLLEQENEKSIFIRSDVRITALNQVIEKLESKI